MKAIYETENKGRTLCKMFSAKSQWYHHSNNDKNICPEVNPGASLVAQSVKNPPEIQETGVWFLGWEDSTGEGNGNTLQYSCLGNLMDRGVWWVTIQGVARVRHNWENKPLPQILELLLVKKTLDSTGLREKLIKSTFSIITPDIIMTLLISFCNFKETKSNAPGGTVIRICLPMQGRWDSIPGSARFHILWNNWAHAP